MRGAKKVAFLFPGQGSQSVGMGKDLYDRFACARRIFDEADQILGHKLSALIWEGPEETLKQTQHTQPAIFVVSVATQVALEERGLVPDLAAGHSIGEYSALVSAGILEFGTALKIVKERGRLMEEAGQKTPGGMAAILGLEAENVKDICRAAAVEGVCEAVNFNAPDQTVIAGSKAAVERALALAKEKGAKRTVLLNVSGAFHSSLMTPAAREMENILRGVPFRNGRCPVVTNCDATFTQDGAEIKKKLVVQIDHPVLWAQSIRAMAEGGTHHFLEVGPGRVLTSLLKRIDRSLSGFCTADDPALEKILSEVHS